MLLDLFLPDLPQALPASAPITSRKLCFVPPLIVPTTLSCASLGWLTFYVPASFPMLSSLIYVAPPCCLV